MVVTLLGIARLVSDVQRQNACSPMVVMLLGSVILLNNVHAQNVIADGGDALEVWYYSTMYMPKTRRRRYAQTRKEQNTHHVEMKLSQSQEQLVRTFRLQENI